MKLMPNTFLTHLVSSNCRKLNERTAQESDFVDHVLELEYVLHLKFWRESISVSLFWQDTKLWTLWMCHFLHKLNKSFLCTHYIQGVFSVTRLNPIE
jgi:hypothetical protein